MGDCVTDGGIACNTRATSAFGAAAESPRPIGMIDSARDATISRMGLDGKVQNFQADRGDLVYATDKVRTTASGSADIKLRDGGTLQLRGQTSDFALSSLNAPPTNFRSVINGVGRPTDPNATPVRTPAAVLGVRG